MLSNKVLTWASLAKPFQGQAHNAQCIKFMNEKIFFNVW